MWVFRTVLMLILAVGLSACGGKFRTYNGPEVTSIQVHKADRKMYLLHNEKVLKKYNVSLGFTPEGHKQFEGDGKTPEGVYTITHRNPNSEFYLSLGVSYPNAQDRAFAAALERGSEHPLAEAIVDVRRGASRKARAEPSTTKRSTA